MGIRGEPGSGLAGLRVFHAAFLKKFFLSRSKSKNSQAAYIRISTASAFVTLSTDGGKKPSLQSAEHKAAYLS